MTTDIRWFAPDALNRLVIPGLVRRGFSIATDGDAPARAVVCMGVEDVEPAWRFARRRGIPVAIYPWDLPPWRLEGGRPDPVLDVHGRLFVVPRPWSRFPERPNYYSRLLHVLGRVRAVWAPSRQTAEDLRRRVQVESIHLPYCYDSVRFTPADIMREPRTLVAVSRLVRSKGFEILLQAAARLTPVPQVRIIGRGTLVRELEAQARALGVPATVETQVSDAGVVDAYRRAAVVVCPSRFEGFGLTGIEALACGAQVVATDIPTHREFLGDNVRYVPAGDVVALAAAIGRALTDRPLPPADLRWLGIDAATERFVRPIEHLLSPQ